MIINIVKQDKDKNYVFIDYIDVESISKECLEEIPFDKIFIPELAKRCIENNEKIMVIR